MDTFLKFTYGYDEESCIVYKKYFGSIDLKTILKSWEIGIENELIPLDRIGFILDYREASFDIKESEIAIVLNFFEKRPSYFKGCKIAFVSESPKDVIIPYLVEIIKKDIKIKPFTTLEAAKIWILTGFS